MKTLFKWLFKGVLTLLLVSGIALIIYLLPAHLQIGRIAPELPSEASLRGLLKLEQGPTRISFLSTSTQVTTDGELGHNSVFIEWPNGDLFLIDPGMDRIQAQEFGALIQKMGPAEDPQIHGDIAELLGDDLERVKAVGFTHLHIDHVQGVTALCRAGANQAVVIQTSIQRNSHNMHTQEGAELVESSCLESTVLDSGESTLDRFPGLAMYPLGGHTPGSTLFAVAVNNRLLLFSGDITNSKTDLIEDRGKGFLYSYILVPENVTRSGELRHWLRKLDQQSDIDVVVSHDLGNMEAVLQAH